MTTLFEIFNITQKDADASYGHGPGGVFSAPGADSFVNSALTMPPGRARKFGKKRKLLKAVDPNVGGGVDRAKLKASDFVFPAEKKFPVVTSGDVSDAVSSWGRYKGAKSFDSFKSALTALAKRKGFESALPAEWKKTTKAGNYGAKAGETIAGNLVRGGDGKFSSGGSATPDAGSAEDKAAIRARMDAAKAPKAKGGKGKAKAAPKGRKAPKGKAVKKTPDQKQAEKDANREKNLSAILKDDGANEALTNVRDDPTTQLNPEYQAKMESAGLIKTANGLTTLTPAGRALMRAAETNNQSGMEVALKRGAVTAKIAAQKESQRQGAAQNRADAAQSRADAAKAKVTRKQIDNPPGGITLFKQANGKLRWVTLSSSSFLDRDRQIFSQKALAADVGRANLDGDYGPLRWFHVPGWDIGMCDYNAMHGRVLVESGTFYDDKLGAAIFKNAEGLGVSLGVEHSIFDPDANGVFHRIKRFERSLMPREYASNLLTAVMVSSIKESDMNEKEKTAFKSLFSDPTEAEKNLAIVLGTAQKSETAALQQGLTYKSVKDKKVGELTLDELTAVMATAQKAAGDGEESFDDGDTPEEEATEESEYVGDMSVSDFESTLGAIVTKAVAAALAIGTGADGAIATVKQVQELESKVVKALTGPVAAATTKAAGEVTTIKTALEAAKAQVTALEARVAELDGGQSRAVKGFRPSQSLETIINGSEELYKAAGNDDLDDIDNIAAAAISSVFGGNNHAQ